MTDTLKNPRAYLQKRVALFTGVSWGFFTVGLLVDWAAPAEGESILSSTRVASLVMPDGETRTVLIRGCYYVTVDVADVRNVERRDPSSHRYVL